MKLYSVDNPAHNMERLQKWHKKFCFLPRYIWYTERLADGSKSYHKGVIWLEYCWQRAESFDGDGEANWHRLPYKKAVELKLIKGDL